MSGRWFTSIVITICCSMVAWALWQRSRDTNRVRDFWGARGANCIQHAEQVELKLPHSQQWQDVSRAPGLIHLRATLVDDRYLQWPAEKWNQNDEGSSASSYGLRFSQGKTTQELAFDPESGRIANVVQQRAVRLIESSRRAVSTYLRELVGSGG